jgi:hypothetical protein
LRQAKTDPFDLVAPPPGTPEQDAAKFRARIARARVADNVRI